MIGMACGASRRYLLSLPESVLAAVAAATCSLFLVLIGGGGRVLFTTSQLLVPLPGSSSVGAGKGAAVCTGGVGQPSVQLPQGRPGGSLPLSGFYESYCGSAFGVGHAADVNSNSAR
jgi:hypothetical protein